MELFERNVSTKHYIMKLVFATGNPNKIKEVAEILQENSKFEIIPMSEIGVSEDIPETSPTIEGNALQKARYLHGRYKVNCFSEDTGLEIESLDGEPGVLSARYAGEDRNAEANIQLVLKKLRENKNRKARFLTVIALIINDKEYTFEGIVEGKIDTKKTGEGGFGYDPIFIPNGFDHSFGVLDTSIKNKISHRGKAIEKLVTFLEKYPLQL